MIADFNKFLCCKEHGMGFNMNIEEKIKWINISIQEADGSIADIGKKYESKNSNME